MAPVTFGERELRAAFEGPDSIPIVAGADQFRGFRDEESADVLTAGGEYTAQAMRQSVVVITADVPATLAIDDPITVDGEPALVRQLAPLDDGRVTRLIYVPNP